MKYMLLINSEESRYPDMSPEDMNQLMADYGRVWGELAEAGVLGDSARLQPTPTATTVRVRDGKTVTTDGPFAETKEQVGGYVVIDVPNLDEAIAWAAKIPSARYGSVEVRPLWVEEGA